MTSPRIAIVGTIAPALAGAVVTVLLSQFAVLSPLYLIPVGVVALTQRPLTVVISVAFTAALTAGAAFALGGAGFGGIGLQSVLAVSAYFALAVGIYAWAIYGADGLRPRRALRTAYRIAVAALLTAASMLLLPLFLGKEFDPLAIFRQVGEAYVAAYKEKAGADVVQQSILSDKGTVDSMAETVRVFVTRGAAVGCAVFYAVSWRFAFTIVAIRKMELRYRPPIGAFKNDAYLLWVLIVSAFGVLGGEYLRVETLAVPAWNILLVSALLYAVQGIAVAGYNLNRPSVPRIVKPLLIFGVVFALFQPGIDAFVAAAFAVLGIAENWLPLRAPIKSEPPSTPGA